MNINFYFRLFTFHDEYCQRSFKIDLKLLCFPDEDVSRGLMSILRYFHDLVGVKQMWNPLFFSQSQISFKWENIKYNQENSVIYIQLFFN